VDGALTISDEDEDASPPSFPASSTVASFVFLAAAAAAFAPAAFLLRSCSFMLSIFSSDVEIGACACAGAEAGVNEKEGKTGADDAKVASVGAGVGGGAGGIEEEEVSGSFSVISVVTASSTGSGISASLAKSTASSVRESLAPSTSPSASPSASPSPWTPLAATDASACIGVGVGVGIGVGTVLGDGIGVDSMATCSWFCSCIT